MPMYEYRCRACGDTFERLRAASEADTVAECRCGSQDTVRLLSMIARTPSSSGSGGASLPMAGGAPSGGGCCGGGCC